MNNHSLELNRYIELLKPEVKRIFEKDSSGHNIDHLERTMNNALYLQKHEGGDDLVIGISAFLHDIHRILQNEKGTYCSPKESLPIVREILEKVNFPEEKIDNVLTAIEYHEEYNWNNPQTKVRDIETLILQDADNLDAIGAIGIGRTFSYGGSHGTPMYNPNILLNSSDDYTEEVSDNDSTIHHFYHKLFKLGDNMNTDTAKRLAKRKISIMKGFVKDFIEEWNGEYKD